jgi:hypothetical protein
VLTLDLPGIFRNSVIGLQMNSAPSFAELSEQPDPKLIPRLDRPGLDESGLSANQLAWRRDGVVVLRRLLPDSLIDTYCERYLRASEDLKGDRPYLAVSELREIALYPPLMHQLRELIGEPMMLHLCLTGWVSSERDWHQDDYLNPEYVNSWYSAVWMALDDVDPDSGPFEYIPGSHQWPLLRREKVRALLPITETLRADWPKRTERFVVPALEAEIERRGAPVRQFIGKRGDVLIWHGRLLHRGSKANRPGAVRKGLICHYSGINHRSDMPRRATDSNGQHYALRTPITVERVVRTAKRVLNSLTSRS